MKEQIKNGIVLALSFVLTLGFIGVTYAALSSLKATSGESLTVAKWDSLVDHSVPSGSVMAFNLETCPTGWTEHTALQGKFIRGADTGANNDPDFTSRTGGVGARKIGSTQDDQFGSHTHVYGDGNADGGGTYYGNVRTGGAQFGQMPVSANTISYAGGNETRPTNVYLLYCEKD